MTSDRRKLLIVDDEATLRKALRMSLSVSGFEVSEARFGEEALAILRCSPIDLVLLDINMPGMSGIEVCRRIRQFSKRVGIIMISVRESEEDKVEALEAGADDFVTKPYRFREMVARLQAVTRRLEAREPAAADPILRAGSLALDVERRVLRKRGVEIHLSPKEFDLFVYLFQHRGAPVLHSKLLRAVWGAEYGGEVQYLRSYVKMLRKKIEDDPARPLYILTEPWIGYRFHDPGEGPTPAADYALGDPSR